MPELDVTTTQPWRSTHESGDGLRATGEVDDFFRWLVAIAARTVGGDISVAITVTRDGRPVTVASSEPDTALFDRMQYGRDEGPCQSAIRADRVVLIQDVARDERFGGFRSRAQVLGVRSTLSIPLHGDARAVGALTLCARHPHAFGHKQRAEAQRFAKDASLALDLAAHRVDGAADSGSWHVGRQVEPLGRPDVEPQPRNLTRPTRPQPATAMGAPDMEAMALESSCWCGSHGGI